MREVQVTEIQRADGLLIGQRPMWRDRATGTLVFPSHDPEALERISADEWLAMERERTRRIEVAAIKAEAATRIAAVDFPEWAQLNAIREGRTDDPRFAEIDAIRAWSNDEETKLAAVTSPVVPVPEERVDDFPS